MEMFKQFSDPLSFDSIRKQDSSTLSDASSVVGSSYSDEEVILASNRPKKRAGRKVFKETRHPIFRGIRKRNGNKWVCELREPSKQSRIWLGTYPTPEMAARAHDVAALALRGKYACLNFADSSWRLPVPTSTDAQEIKRIAAEAAELFKPQEFDDNCQYIEGTNSCSVEDSSEACSDECRSTHQENVSFIDEEEVFDMRRLLMEMAEGLLLSPPRFESDDNTDWNHFNNDSDTSLWY